MPAKIYVIDLTVEERKSLLKLIRQGEGKARKLDRARILLKADEGLSDEQLAKVLDTSSATLGRVRQRFVEEGLEPRSLSDPGGGRERNFQAGMKDLVKYARLHLGKEPFLLSDYSLRDMHRPHWVNEDWGGGYGLGSAISRVGGVTLSGHMGGYKGYLMAFSLCREHSVGVIVLSNSISSDPFGYVEQIYKWVLPEVQKATRKDKPEPDAAWQRYTGTYKGDWGEVMVVVRNKQLEMISVDDMDMPLAVLEPTDEAHTFRSDEQTFDDALFAEPPRTLTPLLSEGSVSLPFELSSNHLYIKGRVGDSRPLNILIDTGAGGSVMNSRTVRELGLEEVGQLEVRGGGDGSQDVGFVKGITLSLDGLSLDDLMLWSVDLTPLEGLEGRTLDLILGYEFISRAVLEID